MRTFRDAKDMAKTLRQKLTERNVPLSHSECLELVAQQLGLPNWNTLAATLDKKPPASLRVPKGWIVSGSRSADYDVGLDETGKSGAALIRYKHTGDDPAEASRSTGFATLMQSILAESYRGRRLMLRARLRTVEVGRAATLWMRIDGAAKGSLRFDNMETRTTNGVLSGTKAWTTRQVILDVPAEAESIHFGFYLRGTGSAWARDFSVQEVGADEAVTAHGGPQSAKPTNLDFVERLEPA